MSKSLVIDQQVARSPSLPFRPHLPESPLTSLTLLLHVLTALTKVQEEEVFLRLEAALVSGH